MKKYLGNKRVIIFLIAPTMILISVMVLYPMLVLVVHSFTEWDGLNPATFNGISNYIKLFKDPIFYTGLKNGLIFAGLQALIQIPLATLLAFAVKHSGRIEKKFFRISYYIPAVLSITVVSQLWLSMYNADNGLINKLFELLGISYRQNWLGDEHWAIVAITMVNIWQFTGYQFILLLSAVNSIPDHYFEAARIDGCTKAQAHIKITIPLMQETYKYCLIIAITGGLNAFASMNIMTGGGPGTSTYTLTYLMYRSAFKIGNYGYGCTSAVMLVVQCLIVSIIINRLVARERIVY
jgi:raffinose/stachyose/melibiose transport system permease protein